MDDAFISEIDDIIKRAKAGRVRLQTLLNLKKKMMAKRKELEALQKKVGRKKPITLIKAQMESQETRMIVLEEALKAAKKSKEYSLEAYVSLLELSIPKAKGLVKFLPNEDGKGYKINLDMNVIGTLDQWAEGVKNWRDELGYGEDGKLGKYSKSSRLKRGHRGRNRSGKSRSYNWARIFAPNVGRFNWTVLSRRNSSSTPNAGFWEILDKGTMNVKLSSDLKGGYPTPVSQPTRFVDKARTALKKLADKLIKDIKSDVGGDFEDLEKQIEKLDEKMVTVLKLIADLSDLSSKELEKKLNKVFPDLVSMSYSVLDELERISEKHTLSKVHWTESTRTVTIGRRITPEGDVRRVRRSVARLKALLLSTFIGE